MKIFQPYFSACSWKALRNPLFAETPPATAISLILYSLAAFRNLSIRMSTTVASNDAARSTLWCSIKSGSSFSQSRNEYKKEVFNPLKL